MSLRTSICDRFGIEPQAMVAAPTLEALTMPEPRLRPPASLAALCSQEPRERAVHTLGKSYDDLVQAVEDAMWQPVYSGGAK